MSLEPCGRLVYVHPCGPDAKHPEWCNGITEVVLDPDTVLFDAAHEGGITVGDVLAVLEGAK
jgi:hypothetical protein